MGDNKKKGKKKKHITEAHIGAEEALVEISKGQQQG
jgi:hypothetical protein